MDESRKAFEQWIASTTNSDLHRSVMLDRRESGAYSHLATENKWEAWQASRAAIEIELPKKTERMEFDTDFDDGSRWGRNDAISECAGIIRAAGIKVKE